MAEVRHYPTSDAIGDWLRRHGGTDGDQRLWTAISSLMRTMSGGSDQTLDIDGTLIEADKGDAKMTYEDFHGYPPVRAAVLRQDCLPAFASNMAMLFPNKNASR